MTKASRLKRLADTQLRLRTLEQLEFERCGQGLAEAEAARHHVLECVAGAGAPEQAWLVAQTGASQRTEKRVEAAGVSVAEQEARLGERAFVCRLVARLHAEAVLQERCRREAGELAETLERVAASWETSARQD